MRKSWLSGIMLSLVMISPFPTFPRPTGIWKEVRATGVQIRQEAKERLEEMREELKAKLEMIRDEKKKNIINRVSTGLCQVNTNRMDNATRQLTKMSEIISRVEARGQREATKGADLTKLNMAVAGAEKAVSEAQTVVNNQSSATCMIEISGDEVKVRAEVRTQINAFKQDIKEVNDAVYKARRAVVTAIKQLALLLGEEVD